VPIEKAREQAIERLQPALAPDAYESALGQDAAMNDEEIIRDALSIVDRPWNVSAISR
jgi:hypothetical protein